MVASAPVGPSRNQGCEAQVSCRPASGHPTGSLVHPPAGARAPFDLGMDHALGNPFVPLLLLFREQEDDKSTIQMIEFSKVVPPSPVLSGEITGRRRL